MLPVHSPALEPQSTALSATNVEDHLTPRLREGDPADAGDPREESASRRDKQCFAPQRAFASDMRMPACTVGCASKDQPGQVPSSGNLSDPLIDSNITSQTVNLRATRVALVPDGWGSPLGPVLGPVKKLVLRSYFG